MLCLPDLKEGMLVGLVGLASGAEVEIGAHAALVADTLDRAHGATITADSVMNLSRLL
jgi:hypothetical protein